MSTLIKIDLKSIKKNPNAGSTQTSILKNIESTFIAKKLPFFFIDGENCIITEIGEGCVKGIIIDEDLINKCIKNKPPDVSIDVKYERETIKHLPEQEYFWKYESVDVECTNCKSVFDHELLEFEEYYGNFSPFICPHCEAWDCCEVEYEKIEDALKRRKRK
jgi:hypothetical protein